MIPDPKETVATYPHRGRCSTPSSGASSGYRTRPGPVCGRALLESPTTQGKIIRAQRVHHCCRRPLAGVPAPLRRTEMLQQRCTPLTFRLRRLIESVAADLPHARSPHGPHRTARRCPVKLLDGKKIHTRLGIAQPPAARHVHLMNLREMPSERIGQRGAPAQIGPQWGVLGYQ